MSAGRWSVTKALGAIRVPEEISSVLAPTETIALPIPEGSLLTVGL